MKIIIFLLALTGVALAAPPIPVAQRKFDHDRHINAARASGKSADCKDCHRLDVNGAVLPGKEHKRCEGCHTYPSSCSTLKTPGPKGPARVCEVCHVAKRKECLPTDLPPPPKEDTFTARFTHGKHLAFGAGIEAGCVSCHAGQAPAPAPKATPSSGHRLCATCHNAGGVAAKLPIATCTGCHTQAAASTSTRPADPFRLAGFDHKAHHAASQKTATCTGCHEKVIGDVPLPTMLGCQTRCHDGAKAFSTVGTKCTQCHKGAEAPAPTRADMSFVHAAHASRNVRIDQCATCHAIEADGKLTPPLAQKDHMPCAASGCHQAEFASRTTKICGVCHDAVAPWAKLTARAKPPAKPEWFESIDHAAHIAKLGTGNDACTSCHGNKLAGGPAPGGHDGCVKCHGRDPKMAKPAMEECGACHVKDPPAGATRSEWAVTAKFEATGGHAKHAIDKRTNKPAQCNDCHAGVRQAKTLAQIKRATMLECDAACHNGKVAFKTTGFECSKCHAAPASRQASKYSWGAPQRTAGLP